MLDYLPCKECGVSTRTWAGHATFCPSCIQARHREGRNRVGVHCKECDRKFYPESRQIPTWDGFCPSCRFAYEVAQGAEVITVYSPKGEPFQVTIPPKPSRFEREDPI